MDKCDAELPSILRLCETQNDRKYLVKGLQANAFVRWKRGNFASAVEIFREIEKLNGLDAALAENLGHTYNALGNLEEAEKYFGLALQLPVINGPGKSPSVGAAVTEMSGGSLLGLGIVHERRGNYAMALEFTRRAIQAFRLQSGSTQSSLVAKAQVSLAKMLLATGAASEALVEVKKAAVAFNVTCGPTSPLVANALRVQSCVLRQLGSLLPAYEALIQAYVVEASKDAFDLSTLTEMHFELLAVLGEMVERGHAVDTKTWQSPVDLAKNRVDKMIPQDGNCGVYYKLAAEVALMNGEKKKAKLLLERAVALLDTETTVDCSGLVKECRMLLNIAEN